MDTTPPPISYDPLDPRVLFHSSSYYDNIKNNSPLPNLRSMKKTQKNILHKNNS